MNQLEINGIQKRKEEVKLSPFAGDMILHTGNPRDANKNLLELISEFGKVSDHRINIQKAVTFLIF